GDVFDFAMRSANLTFMEAAQELGRRAGVEVETSPDAAQRASEREQVLRALDAARDYFRASLASVGRKARGYLERRGMSEEIAGRFHLGYAPPGWDGMLTALQARGYPAAVLEQAGLAAPRASGGYYDVFRDRLMFPILDLQDRVVAFGGRALDEAEPKYLNSKETLAFSKGRVLYALSAARDAIRERGEVLVVEGYMDVLACHQFGFRNAVASLGTALTADQVGLLRRFAPHAVLMYDPDQAGAAAAERGLALCEEAEVSVRVAVLPSGEDPDAYLRRHGAEAFGRLLAGALPMFEYRLEAAALRHGPDLREGKLALVDEMLDVIQTVANPVRAAEYLRTLAGRFALPEEALRQRLRSRKRSGRSPAQQRGALAPSGDRAREEAERLLLHLMVAEPARRTEIARVLDADVFSVPAHRALAAVILVSPEADAVMLREGLDEAASALLVRLVFEPPPVTERDKDRAAAEAVRYLVHTSPAAVERERLWVALQAAQMRGDEAELRRLQAAYADLITAGRQRN
ncbi:MAG: DNA primase, partial [bacterium]|nr:DNA primase [bacterium]